MESKVYLKNLIGTLLGCALMLFFTLPRHGGFILIFFLLFLMPLSLYSIFVMYRKSEERKLRATKLAIWSIAIIVVLVTNYQRHINTRLAADDAARAILQYKDTHNEYPESLDVVGISSSKYRKKHRISYFLRENEPAFLYPVTYIVFDAYLYNFDKRAWEYAAD